MIRLAVTLVLLASWLLALTLWLELADSEERRREAGRRLELETGRREDIESRYLREKLSQDLLYREVEKHLRAASRPGLPPKAPPAEPVEAAALRAQINRALRNAGHERVRFFRLRKGPQGEVLGVQVHVLAENGVAAEAYVAERARLLIDLEALVLRIVLEDGVHLAAGERHPLPPEGLSLSLSRSTAAHLCGDLGGIAEQRGNLPPEPVAAPVRDDTTLSSAEKEEWIDRVNTLLSLADPAEKLRCIDLRDVTPDAFLDVVLLGYARGFMLDRTFTASAMSFEADDGSGLVHLCLKGGTLERKGRTVPLHGDGYRLVLLGVKPEDAARLLQGRVHR